MEFCMGRPNKVGAAVDGGGGDDDAVDVVDTVPVVVVSGRRWNMFFDGITEKQQGFFGFGSGSVALDVAPTCPKHTFFGSNLSFCFGF
jgi:hypothetical protein